LYCYGPFGEVIRNSGAMAKVNPFRFSTKYQDDESDLLYYGYRYFNTSAGRWLSRDPVKEHGGINVNAFGSNDAINKNDSLGLWATGVHHQIVEDWLTDPIYRDYPFRCCDIDVVKLIQDGSDEVDGVLGNGFPWLSWCEAQSSKNAYQHAMSDGEAYQSVNEAEQLYKQFIDRNLMYAGLWAIQAKAGGQCYRMEWAIKYLGHAYHSFSDSLSPAHSGFQPWWGPYDGWIGWGGFPSYMAFVNAHEAQETDAVYASMKVPVVAAVNNRFKAFLDYLLKDSF
jgi:RHS repeat-associated protein